VAGQVSAILLVQASDTTHLEETLERIRHSPGVRATETQIILSTLFERPLAARGR
jgi:DNA-binding Lrp family transcriptional regulator